MSSELETIAFLNQYDLPRIVEAAKSGRLAFVLGRNRDGDVVAVLAARDEPIEGAGRCLLPLAHLALDADPLVDYSPMRLK
jgi:hypothetical protein